MKKKIKMNTIESNELIAEFMGREIQGHRAGPDGITLFDKKFKSIKYNDFNSLMPVVSKITRDESFVENEYRESIMDTVPYGIIEDTYKTIIEFINFYNKIT